MSAPNELSFLPEDYLEQKYLRRAMILCGIVFVVVGASLFFWWQVRSKAHAKIVAEFNQVNDDYVEAARKIEQVKKMHEQQREVVHHAELAASLVERVPRSNMLAEITNALPVGVSLIDLTMISTPRSGPAPVATSSFAMHRAEIEKQSSDALGLGTKPSEFDIKLKFTGVAHDDIQVAQLISRLSHNPMFRDVNLIVSDTLVSQQAPGEKGKAENLRRWQLEMMINPQAEVREDTRTAAVELNK